MTPDDIRTEKRLRQVSLRIPLTLYDLLKADAESHRKSLNDHIVDLGSNYVTGQGLDGNTLDCSELLPLLESLTIRLRMRMARPSRGRTRGIA